MPIYRSNDVTKYPQEFLDKVTLLPGLEQATGADLLITLDETRLTNLCADPLPYPLQDALKHCINAGLLVQIKIGRDYTSSIPELSNILYRMLQWSHRPYLVNILDLKRDKDSNALVDGQLTEYTWNECDGACHWWQLRGGYVEPFPLRKSDLLQWCNDWLPRLRKLQEEKIHFITRPTQQFVFPNDGRADILSRMMSPSFSASGVQTALKLLSERGSLADCIAYLSDPANEKENHIADVGPKRFEQFRKNLELTENMTMQILPKEQSL